MPHAQPADQLEMLVDESDRSVRANRSRVGFDRAEGDVRERRFAGTVLADERVNLSRREREVDAVDRLDAGKVFDDAAQLERGRV